MRRANPKTGPHDVTLQLRPVTRFRPAIIIQKATIAVMHSSSRTVLAY